MANTHVNAAVLQVTPASYLELLTTFIKLLAEKRKDIGMSRQRLEAGLSKLLTTAAQVELMQVHHHLHQPINQSINQSNIFSSINQFSAAPSTVHVYHMAAP